MPALYLAAAELVSGRLWKSKRTVTSLIGRSSSADDPSKLAQGMVSGSWRSFYQGSVDGPDLSLEDVRRTETQRWKEPVEAM